MNINAPESRPIDSLNSFLTTYQELKSELKQECKTSKNSDFSIGELVFYYRGEDKEHEKLNASIYRDGGYQCHEREIYKDALRRMPQEFAGDESVFTKLVRMQHYGIPTRLLDITTNPLVALFFACETELGSNGQVYVFCCPEPFHRYYDDYDLRLTLGIEKDFPLEQLLKKAIGILTNALVEFTRGRCDERIVALRERCFQYLTHGKEWNWDSYDLLVVLQQEINEFLLRGDQNPLNREETEEEHQAFLEQRGAFQNALCRRSDEFLLENCAKFNIKAAGVDGALPAFTSLFQGIGFSLVLPLYNNERVKRQCGAFFVQGKYGDVKDSILKYRKIIIKSEAKRDILEKLKDYEITRGYLFPELDQYAKDVRAKYGTRKQQELERIERLDKLAHLAKEGNLDEFYAQRGKDRIYIALAANRCDLLKEQCCTMVEAIDALGEELMSELILRWGNVAIEPCFGKRFQFCRKE
ncbi:MAG: FRG domain-containing protein [Burkholderiales bacterium]|jgi:hypothetical protein|nr:FRG domain-containing protein [Burkholderiales bacterium]